MNSIAANTDGIIQFREVYSLISEYIFNQPKSTGTWPPVI